MSWWDDLSQPLREVLAMFLVFGGVVGIIITLAYLTERIRR